MFLHQLAPAGTPIALSDLASCLVGQLMGRQAIEEFRRAICERYGVRHCVFVSTGRAAFSLILQALRDIAPKHKDEVVIPSYTCYSVPASVARAGLKVRVCDVDPSTLDYDYRLLESVDFQRVLCIASANLYGIPNDLTRLRGIAARNDTLLLDDAAQSMDARVDGRYSGTLGDVGFFSLDKGKNITTIDGGVVITDRHDIGERIEGLAIGLKPVSATTRVKYLAKLLTYSAFLRPRLYWIPEGLPFLKLGATPYPDDVAIEGYPRFLAGLGKRLFERIDSLTATRIENARYAIARLRELEAVRLVSARPGICPVYLRLPILVVGGNRQRAIAELKRQGIGATGSFPTAVADIPGIDPTLFRGPLHADRGRWVANHILTLPTHAYVTREALDRAVRILGDSTSTNVRAGWAAP